MGWVSSIAPAPNAAPGHRPKVTAPRWHVKLADVPDPGPRSGTTPPRALASDSPTSCALRYCKERSIVVDDLPEKLIKIQGQNRA
jgi:hypothetical protein